MSVAFNAILGFNHHVDVQPWSCMLGVDAILGFNHHINDMALVLYVKCGRYSWLN